VELKRMRGNSKVKVEMDVGCSPKGHKNSLIPFVCITLM
jgi:hypothetical protein